MPKYLIELEATYIVRIEAEAETEEDAWNWRWNNPDIFIDEEFSSFTDILYVQEAKDEQIFVP